MTSLAQEKYEKWMQQYQHEIKRAIDRALKGENEDIRTVCETIVKHYYVSKKKLNKFSTIVLNA